MTTESRGRAQNAHHLSAKVPTITLDVAEALATLTGALRAERAAERSIPKADGGTLKASAYREYHAAHTAVVVAARRLNAVLLAGDE